MLFLNIDLESNLYVWTKRFKVKKNSNLKYHCLLFSKNRGITHNFEKCFGNHLEKQKKRRGRYKEEKRRAYYMYDIEFRNCTPSQLYNILPSSHMRAREAATRFFNEN